MNENPPAHYARFVRSSSPSRAESRDLKPAANYLVAAVLCWAQPPRRIGGDFVLATINERGRPVKVTRLRTQRAKRVRSAFPKAE